MNTSKAPLSAIVLCKNESSMLPGCLDCLQWCAEIIVVDTGSTDDSVSIAKKMGARVVEERSASFAEIRTNALENVKQPWVIYIDADERVSPALAEEIQAQIEQDDVDALTINRKNIFFGREFKHGGWERDAVTRVFRRSALKGWTGDIHESPQFDGQSKTLTEPLIHFSHRSVADGLRKSAEWTQLEARAFVEQGAPTVTPMLVWRKFFGEIYRRLVRWGGFKDGNAGVYEAIIQACNRAFVYIQIWEQQQRPTLTERYDEYEQTLRAQWQSHKRV